MSSEETSDLTEEKKDDYSPKEEISEEESQKNESPKEELPEEESNKEKPSQEESSKEDSSKDASSQSEDSEVEPPQSEESKVETPKSEETKSEPPQSESNQQQSSTSSSETPSQSDNQNSENSNNKPVEDLNKRPDIPLEKRYATRSEDTSKYEMKLGLSLFGKKKKRLPFVKVSPMNYLTQGFNFIVTLNEFMFGFKSVSGLSIDKGYDFITEGGVNDHAVKVGRPTSNDGHKLTFERGLMIRVSTLIEGAAKAAASLIPDNLLRKTALLGLSALNPQESLETGPAIGTIQVYNRSNELTAIYSFLSLGMSEWSVDDLNADNGEVLIEHITIVHTGLTRVPLGLGTVAKRATMLESEYQAAEIREDRAEILAKFAQMSIEKENQAKARRDAFLAECEAEKTKLKRKSERRLKLLKESKDYVEKDIAADLEEKKKEQEEFESIQKQAEKDLKEKLEKKKEENRKEQEKMRLEREKTSKKMRQEYEDKMKKLKESGANQKEIEDAKKEYEEKAKKEDEKQKEMNAKQEAELKEIHKEYDDKMKSVKKEREENRNANAEKKKEERKERMKNCIDKLNKEYEDLPNLQLGENGEILEEKEDKEGNEKEDKKES